MFQLWVHGAGSAIAWAGPVAIGLAIGAANPALTQITPDATLGGEASRVAPGTVGGRTVDRIEGGAQRGQNLFHSFREFNIRDRQRVYFNNPADVSNILTRVTGNTRSNIQGVLGVDGGANLFLLNPNGIVFGPNAQLDVRGSFLATTANSFVFPNGLTFGADNPQAPLLSVSTPIGLQYGRQPGAIRSRAGLFVDSGQSLVLAGGAVNLENSFLAVRFPQGGRIELGGVRTEGTVRLNRQGNLFSLGFPADLERADVSLRNSILDATAESGGDIAITARSLSVLERSELLAGIAAGYGFRGSQAGDIIINATETVRVNQGSSIINIVSAASDTDPEAIGNAGDIHISTDSLSVRDGAQLDASTLGSGNSGNVIINARNRVEFVGNGSAASSSAGGVSSSGQLIAARGRGGDVRIFTGSLSVRDGAQLDASTFGSGNAGDIIIEARDHVEFIGRSGVSSSAGGFSPDGQPIVARGRGGDVRISTNILSVRDGAQLDASTLGSGDSGNVIINARDRVEFIGRSTAFSRAGSFSPSGQVIFANGRGGDVRISTGSLSVRDRAQLDASAFDSGDAGNVIIEARDLVEFVGSGSAAISSAGGSSPNGQVIFASGRGGNVLISTGSLSVRDGAQLNASTLGSGESGDVVIEARDRVEFVGNESATFSRSGGISSKGEVIIVSGQGGDVRISTDILSVRDGALLDARTFGSGNSGNVIIEARDRVEFVGSGSVALSSSGSIGQEPTASGQGGDVRISTDFLSVRDGARLDAESLGTGNAGNILLNANLVSLDRGQITTETISRNGGNITLRNAVFLGLLNNSTISTSAGLILTGGDGGNISLDANLIVASIGDNNDISANAFNGRGGAVSITGQLAGLELLSREELQARLGTTDPVQLDAAELASNDITAISQTAPTLNGQVTVNPPEVDPSRGLAELPVVLADPANQIGQTCPANAAEADRLGNFIISGRGGLPVNPTELLSGDNVMSEWVTASDATTRAKVELSQPVGEAIAEAQSWVVDAQGKVVLVAPATSTASSAPGHC